MPTPKWRRETYKDDPIEKLAEFGELRPEDVPALRRLHAQRLVVDALRAPDCDYSLRKGEVYRMAETLGVNPAALVAELLRGGEIPAPAGPPARLATVSTKGCRAMTFGSRIRARATPMRCAASERAPCSITSLVAAPSPAARRASRPAAIRSAGGRSVPARSVSSIAFTRRTERSSSCRTLATVNG